jgi:hypothetical protein
VNESLQDFFVFQKKVVPLWRTPVFDMA